MTRAPCVAASADCIPCHGPALRPTSAAPAARGADYVAVCRAADDLRRRVCGDTVTFVVNRNINYTNVCTYACSFCAFRQAGPEGGRPGV